MVSERKKAVIDTELVGICLGMLVGIIGIFSKWIVLGYITAIMCPAAQVTTVMAMIYSLDLLAQLEKNKKFPFISSSVTAYSVQRQ